MLGFSFGVACGSKRFEYFTSNMRFFVFLRSRDVENCLFRIKIIQIDIVNVVGRWKYEFLRICWGPARARSPQGPRRAQGRAQGRAPAGPDPRRAPPGPRAPQGPIPAGPHQGPGEGPGEGPPGPRARCERLMIHFGGGNVSGRLKFDFFIIINASIICIYNMCL